MRDRHFSLTHVLLAHLVGALVPVTVSGSISVNVWSEGEESQASALLGDLSLPVDPEWPAAVSLAVTRWFAREVARGVLQRQETVTAFMAVLRGIVLSCAPPRLRCSLMCVFVLLLHSTR